jgi:hypothetical protein
VTHVGYLVAGWGITFVACAVYAVSVMRRSRKLSERVPAERARWMASKDADRIGES